jgi:CheY-like chemotaxis protein
MTGIMVVDDQPINRRIIARLAGAVESGLQVITFGNPLDALAHAAHDTPELLITDYKMTPFDGDELIERFRRLPDCEDIPVIVITAHRDPELRNRAMIAGATDFFLAPLDHDAFRMRFRRALAQSRQQTLLKRPVDSFGSWSRSAVSPSAGSFGDLAGFARAELASMLDELQAAQDDLHNLVTITGIAAIFVDNQLRVRSFTPLAQSVYRLTPDDLGRRLTEVETDLDYRTLERDFTSVSVAEAIVEHHLTTLSGDAYYLLRMTPYRRMDGSADGATLSLTRMGI